MLRRVALGVLCLIVPLSGYAGPTAGRPMSVEELTKGADVVVIGEVLSTQSEWDPTGRVILTRVDMHVEELLKGSPTGQRLSFQQLGGQVGDTVSVVAGSPSFSRGERVLLFLSRRRDGRFDVENFFQGKFSLEHDPASGREMAVRRVPDSAQVLDRLQLDEARSRVLKALNP